MMLPERDDNVIDLSERRMRDAMQRQIDKDLDVLARERHKQRRLYWAALCVAIWSVGCVLIWWYW